MSPLMNLGLFLMQNPLYEKPLHKSSGRDFFQDVHTSQNILEMKMILNLKYLMLSMLQMSDAPNASNASNASKAVGTPTNCNVEDLVNHLDKLCLEASKPISTTSSASPPVQPPSPKLAPAQVIAMVC